MVCFLEFGRDTAPPAAPAHGVPTGPWLPVAAPATGCTVAAEAAPEGSRPSGSGGKLLKSMRCKFAYSCSFLQCGDRVRLNPQKLGVWHGMGTSSRRAATNANHPGQNPRVWRSKHRRSCQTRAPWRTHEPRARNKSPTRLFYVRGQVADDLDLRRRHPKGRCSCLSSYRLVINTSSSSSSSPPHHPHSAVRSRDTPLPHAQVTVVTFL